MFPEIPAHGCLCWDCQEIGVFRERQALRDQLDEWREWVNQLVYSTAGDPDGTDRQLRDLVTSRIESVVLEWRSRAEVAEAQLSAIGDKSPGGNDGTH
jgi:hypothetical protein